MATTHQKRPKPSPRKRTRKRWQVLPTVRPGATEFTSDPVINNPDWLVQELTSLTAAGAIDDVGAEISQLLNTGEGRPRAAGDPFKAYCAYVAAKKVGVETFWKDFGTHSFWQTAGYAHRPNQPAGFEHRPSFPSLWRWFAELERPEIVRAIEQAGDKLVQLAARNDPDIGKNVSTDFTAFLSPNRAYHVCRGDRCPRAKGKQKQSRERMHTKTQRMSMAEVSKERHDESKTEPLPDRSSERVEVRKRHRRMFTDSEARTWVIWRNSRGCLLICRDTSAGARSYKGGKRAWVGGYRGATVDMKYGGTLANLCFGAHRREHAGFGALLRKTESALDGRRPESFSADRGLAINSVFYRLERRNIDPVIPWRIPHARKPEMAHEREEHWDEDGPRCRHCGGPTTYEGPGLGRHLVGRKPVIRFKCLLGLERPNCDAIQSIPCARNPRILTGISRTSERYNAIKAIQENMERSFMEGRARYGLSGKDTTLRLRRRGVDAHRLRAAVARYLEWLYICLRHGWLGAHPYRNNKPAIERHCRDGEDRAKRKRRLSGVLLPYGPQAYKLGLVATPDIPRPATRPVPKKKKQSTGGGNQKAPPGSGSSP